MSLTLTQQPDPKRARALFQQFQFIYGAKLHKAWEGVKMDDLFAYWERELADWTDAEIAKAVADCRKYGDGFPPTLPEFITLCRTLNRVPI